MANSKSTLAETPAPPTDVITQAEEVASASVALETAPATRNLYQRLLAVMSDLDKLPKTGKNTHFNYNYHEAQLVLAYVRPKLVEHGVLILPSLESAERTDVKDGGRNSIHTVAHISFLLVNADDPTDTLTLHWDGEGLDSGDKSTSKATTSGVKYFLMKLFMISDKDDPDGDSPSGDGERTRRESGRAGTASNKGADTAAKGSAPAEQSKPATARQEGESFIEAAGEALKETSLVDGFVKELRAARSMNALNIASARIGEHSKRGEIGADDLAKLRAIKEEVKAGLSG